MNSNMGFSGINNYFSNRSSNANTAISKHNGEKYFVSNCPNVVDFIFLKKPTYLNSPIARNKNIITIIHSPYFNSQPGKNENNTVALAKLKTAKHNRTKPTKKHSGIFGFNTFSVSTLVGIAVSAPHRPPSPQ